MTRGILRFFSVLCAAGLASVLVAETAYVESFGQLFEFDPDTGIHHALGSTGTESRFIALAFGPDERLFGYGWDRSAPDGLFELDPESGMAVRIGDLGVEDLQGFAVDAEGRMWAHRGDALYSIDSATGEATFATILERPVGALTTLGSELYAVADTFEALFIDRVDTETGLLRSVLEVEPALYGLTDVSFDSAGNLRLLYVCGGILTQACHAFYRVDMRTGFMEQTYIEGYDLSDPVGQMLGIAIRGSDSVLDIPTLGNLGAVFFASILAFAGAWALKRRVRYHQPR